MIDGLMAGRIIKSRECGEQGVWWVATRNGSVTKFSLRGDRRAQKLITDLINGSVILSAAKINSGEPLRVRSG